MMNDMHFQFDGFKPDEKIKDFISTVAEKIHLSAPSDSTTHFAIKQSKDMINVSCKTASRIGTFMAEATGVDITQALQNIEQKMRKQIDRWKKRRFEKILEKSF